MGLLDAYKSQINAYFSEWIKINDDEKSFAYRDIITKDISLKYYN